MPKSTFQRKPKRKFCQFCAEKQDYIDYKDVNLLRKFGSSARSWTRKVFTSSSPSSGRPTRTRSSAASGVSRPRTS